MRRIMLCFATFLAIFAVSGSSALADGGTRPGLERHTSPTGAAVVAVGGLGAHQEVEIRPRAQRDDQDFGTVSAADAAAIEGERSMASGPQSERHQIIMADSDTKRARATLTVARMRSATTSVETLPTQRRSLRVAALLVAIFGVLGGFGLFLAYTAWRASRRSGG